MSANKTNNTLDGTRFIDGVTAKGKLIGVEDVKDETGDDICNTSMVKLKAVVIAKKEHKLPILIKISLEGVSIIDAKTNEVLHKHAVDRISYISRDPTDPRAFGYIFKNPKNELQYIAIKTERQSAEVVLTLKDLFEVVYEKNKLEKEKAKENNGEVSTQPTNNVAVKAADTVPVQPPQIQTQQSNNIFDLDDTPPQTTLLTEVPKLNPPPQQQQQQQQQPQQQQSNNIDIFSLQEPVAPTPQISSQSDNILDFLTSAITTPSSSALPVAAPVNVPTTNTVTADFLNLSLTPDQLKGPDKFAALKAQTASLSSSLSSPPNQFSATPSSFGQPLYNQQGFGQQMGSPMNNQFGSPMGSQFGSYGSNQFGSQPAPPPRPAPIPNQFLPNNMSNPSFMNQLPPQTMSSPPMNQFQGLGNFQPNQMLGGFGLPQQQQQQQQQPQQPQQGLNNLW